MDSTAAPASQNSSEIARPSAPKTSNNTEPTSELHQRTSQDTSKEAEEQPPKKFQLGADADTRTELQKYDEKAKIWIMLHICWLAWNIFTSCPYFARDIIQPLFSFRPGALLGNSIFLLFLTAPYTFQLLGIYKRSLKATNRGVKFLCFQGFFVAIAFGFTCFAFFYADQIYALMVWSIQFTKEKMPDHPHLANMPPLPSQEKFKEVTWEGFKFITERFAYYVVGYFAARKFRNYLNQRQKLVKKTE